MQLCSRCHKRMAVVFVTKLENNESKNEGLCLICAKQLGIPQVSEILDKMGIDDEDLENMDKEMNGLIASEGEDEDNDDDGDEADSRTPSIDFAKLFGGLPFENAKGGEKSEKTEKKKEKGKKKDDHKFLGQYCRDLTAAAREGKLDAVIGRDTEVASALCRRCPAT